MAELLSFLSHGVLLSDYIYINVTSSPNLHCISILNVLFSSGNYYLRGTTINLSTSKGGQQRVAECENIK